MIKLIKINIRGMHNCIDTTYALKDFTYLFGKNGAGKTTVLEAIQFALLGYIPGYNKTPAGILAHSNGDKLAVLLTMNDGEKDITVLRECASFDGKARINTVIEPQVDLEEIIADIESPVFNFNEFIGLTANKLKEWFISFLGNGDSTLKWADIFVSEKGSDIALQKQLLDYTKEKPVDIESLKDINEYLKSLLSNRKAELERITGTIQNLVHYDDIDVPTEDIDALRAERDTLTAKKTYAIQYEERVAHNKVIQIKLDTPEYAELKASLDEDDNYYDLIEAQMEIDNEFNTVLERLKANDSAKATLTEEIGSLTTILKSNGTCPYTNKACADITTLKTKYQQEFDKLNTELNTMNESATELYSKQKELSAQKSSIASKLSNIQARYNERDRLQTSLLPVTDAPEYTAAAIEDQLKALEDRIIKAETNLKYYSMIDTLTKDKLACESSIELLKDCIKKTGANGLQSQLANGAFKLLSENMDGYIKALYGDETLSTHFVLEEKANSFSFGLIRDNKYISYDLLSSGERCIFTLAMLLCLIANAKSELKLILLDDLLDHIDDDKIKILFSGLNKVKNIQIILAGIKKYTESNYDEIVTTIN